jgi:hypothetical protein
MFWDDLDESSVEKIIIFLEEKKYDFENLIDIWFDDQDIGDGFVVVGESDEKEEEYLEAA